MKTLLFLIFILVSSYCNAGHSCLNKADEASIKSHKSKSSINVGPDRTGGIPIQLIFPSVFNEKKIGGVAIYREEEKAREEAYTFFLFVDPVEDNNSAVAFEIMESMIKDSHIEVYYKECGLVFSYSLELWIAENDKTP